MSLGKQYSETFKALRLVWVKLILLYIPLFATRIAFNTIFQPQNATSGFISSAQKAIVTAVQTQQVNTSFIVHFIILIIMAIFAGIFLLFPFALVVTILKQRKKKTTLIDDIAQGALYIAPLITTGFLAAIPVGLGLFSLIIPGIVIALLFSFAPHLVIYSGKVNKEALIKSTQLVKKHLGTILVKDLAVLVPLLVVSWAAGFLISPLTQSAKTIVGETLVVLEATFLITYLTVLFEELK